MRKKDISHLLNTAFNGKLNAFSQDFYSKLDRIKNSGVGFWNISGESIFIWVIGINCNDPNQWINAHAIEKEFIRYLRAPAKPDAQSGHLIIELRKP